LCVNVRRTVGLTEKRYRQSAAIVAYQWYITTVYCRDYKHAHDVDNDRDVQFSIDTFILTTYIILLFSLPCHNNNNNKNNNTNNNSNYSNKQNILLLILNLFSFFLIFIFSYHSFFGFLFIIIIAIFITNLIIITAVVDYC